MKKLVQANDNAQVNGVTAGEVALCKTLNENAQELGTLGEIENGVQAGKTSLQRVYDTIEDNGNVYTNVRVEGVTPNRMKNLINTQIKKVIPDSDGVTFQTPGEPIVVNNGIDGTENRKGVVQIYNNAIIDSSVTAPEITTLTVNPVSGLTAPLTVDTVVANLSTEGGTAPYTYTLKDSTADNAEFKIDGTTVKVGTQIDAGGNKNITVVVTDKNNKTKEQTAEIVIGA